MSITCRSCHLFVIESPLLAARHSKKGRMLESDCALCHRNYASHCDHLRGTHGALAAGSGDDDALDGSAGGGFDAAASPAGFEDAAAAVAVPPVFPVFAVPRAPTPTPLVAPPVDAVSALIIGRPLEFALWRLRRAILSGSADTSLLFSFVTQVQQSVHSNGGAAADVLSLPATKLALQQFENSLVAANRASQFATSRLADFLVLELWHADVVAAIFPANRCDVLSMAARFRTDQRRCRLQYRCALQTALLLARALGDEGELFGGVATAPPPYALDRDSPDISETWSGQIYSEALQFLRGVGYAELVQPLMIAMWADKSLPDGLNTVASVHRVVLTVLNASNARMRRADVWIDVAVLPTVAGLSPLQQACLWQYCVRCVFDGVVAAVRDLGTFGVDIQYAGAAAVRVEFAPVVALFLGDLEEMYLPSLCSVKWNSADVCFRCAQRSPFDKLELLRQTRASAVGDAERDAHCRFAVPNLILELPLFHSARHFSFDVLHVMDLGMDKHFLQALEVALPSRMWRSLVVFFDKFGVTVRGTNVRRTALRTHGDGKHFRSLRPVLPFALFSVLQLCDVVDAPERADDEDEDAVVAATADEDEDDDDDDDVVVADRAAGSLKRAKHARKRFTVSQWRVWMQVLMLWNDVTSFVKRAVVCNDDLLGLQALIDRLDGLLADLPRESACRWSRLPKWHAVVAHAVEAFRVYGCIAFAKTTAPGEASAKAFANTAHALAPSSYHYADALNLMQIEHVGVAALGAPLLKPPLSIAYEYDAAVLRFLFIGERTMPCVEFAALSTSYGWIDATMRFLAARAPRRELTSLTLFNTMRVTGTGDRQVDETLRAALLWRVGRIGEDFSFVRFRTDSTGPTVHIGQLRLIGHCPWIDAEVSGVRPFLVVELFALVASGDALASVETWQRYEPPQYELIEIGTSPTLTHIELAFLTPILTRDLASAFSEGDDVPAYCNNKYLRAERHEHRQDLFVGATLTTNPPLY
jgi:hypothetical protein